MFSYENNKIAVIGLGYVGLPLAVEFGKKYRTTGFDINKRRIDELADGFDNTLELTSDDILFSSRLSFTSDEQDLAESNIYIITVPTPVDENKQPDMSCLVSASRMVCRYLKYGDIVIYESTVYPGATEEICIPVLSSEGMKFNEDFFVGYSPERINPGDKNRKLPDIIKITSGSTDETARKVNDLYSSVITAGTYSAPSIKVAEAAKVIENTQRDINIALINEFSMILSRMNIDTMDVLNAAKTKWNFLDFTPGLVGGHCISVDPYYLLHKAQAVGYYPALVDSGRRINNNMPIHITQKFVTGMIERGINIKNAKVLLLGVTFKENCADIRNTRVFDVINELNKYHIDIEVYDPWVCTEELQREYGVTITYPKLDCYDGIMLLVPHENYGDISLDNLRLYGKNNVLIFDLKGVISERSDVLRV